MSAADLAQVVSDGRLIRREWSREEDGRQLLCLYTALAGDPDARPATCPADLAPRWIAHLLPWLDDAPSAAAWPGIVDRIVALAPRLATIPPEVEWRVRARIVREAMRSTEEPGVLAVCERVAVLCERRGRGEEVSDQEFAEAAAEAAEAEAWAAEAAEAAAAEAWAAEAAEAAAAAAEAAWAAAAAAADRIADAILAELEAA
jgi:hypothetical protein